MRSTHACARTHCASAKSRIWDSDAFLDAVYLDRILAHCACGEKARAWRRRRCLFWRQSLRVHDNSLRVHDSSLRVHDTRCVCMTTRCVRMIIRSARHFHLCGSLWWPWCSSYHGRDWSFFMDSCNVGEEVVIIRLLAIMEIGDSLSIFFSVSFCC